MLRVLFTYRVDRVMEIEKMITKKEDLINTYIKNDHGELRDLYTKKAIDLGLSINIASIVTSSLFIFTKTNHGRCGNVDHSSSLDYLVSKYGPMRELTISDLKPRTKTEFVKCEFKSRGQALDSYDDEDELYVVSASSDTGYSECHTSSDAIDMWDQLYRKVETEIDERQEFIDECMIIGGLRARDGAREVYGNLFDSGKFKLAGGE